MGKDRRQKNCGIHVSESWNILFFLGLPATNQKRSRTKAPQPTNQHYLTRAPVHHGPQHHRGVLDCRDWQSEFFFSPWRGLGRKSLLGEPRRPCPAGIPADPSPSLPPRLGFREGTDKEIQASSEPLLAGFGQNSDFEALARSRWHRAPLELWVGTQFVNGVTTTKLLRWKGPKLSQGIPEIREGKHQNLPELFHWIPEIREGKDQNLLELSSVISWIQGRKGPKLAKIITMNSWI